MFGILRTVLAINVVLLHIFSVPVFGNYSVSFFFLLSGFLMTHICKETYGYTFKGFKLFWLNRFLRLYPIYYIIIFITILGLLIYPNVIRQPHLFIPSGLIEWFSNITMIFPNIVPHRYIPRLSPTSWALTNELLFYVLISFGISKTLKRTLFWLLLSIAYYIGTYLYYDISTYRYSALPAASLPFALGACLYYFNRYIRYIDVSFRMIIICISLFYINALGSLYLPKDISESSIYINMALAFIIILMLYNFKPTDRLKKIDLYIGMYSYPIYLSHYFVALIYSGAIGYGVIDGSFKIEFKGLIPFFMILFFFNLIFVNMIELRINKFKKQLKKNYFSDIKD